jgi:DNA-binding MarR family transcriptional regulator
MHLHVCRPPHEGGSTGTDMPTPIRLAKRQPHAPAARRARASGAGPPSADAFPDYVRRGPECVFANVKMLSRLVGSVYDEALRPAELRASQLALMWAIAACEPVAFGTLERVTESDQTTLSRTVKTLEAARLAIVTRGRDRRTRVIRLTTNGRARFLAAMPYWERAQRQVSAWLSLRQARELARAARRAAQRTTHA